MATKKTRAEAKEKEPAKATAEPWLQEIDPAGATLMSISVPVSQTFYRAVKLPE